MRLCQNTHLIWALGGVLAGAQDLHDWWNETPLFRCTLPSPIRLRREPARWHLAGSKGPGAGHAACAASAATRSAPGAGAATALTSPATRVSRDHCAWKRDAKQSGKLSVFDFVSLARPISQALDSGLASLDASSPDQRLTVGSRRKDYYRRHDRAANGTSLETVTRIRAHAAKVYLSVTLSGWQPNSTEIQYSVAEVLSLLKSIESPAQLQSLTWPVCIAGCLAIPHQRQDVRTIAKDL
ncbi:uncharacterized protein PG986_002874 [Apiospora aurea]|uniref:Uncharacterized protein n=1 Tax=Apiospora aurea TaxID=335848 RepID=A0ABR1QQ15_9PEZI